MTERQRQAAAAKADKIRALAESLGETLEGTAMEMAVNNILSAADELGAHFRGASA